jgi:Protein of unknown function (DUF998)
VDKPKETLSTKLFWTVIFEIVLYVVLDIVAQALPPHYSPISQAESDLAVGNFGVIMTINFLNRGILSLLFIFAFLQTVNLTKVPQSQFRAGTYLLGIWAVGALILAIIPTDVPPTPISWHGAIHLVIAIIAFIGGAFGTLAISLNLGENQALIRLRRIALPLSEIVVLFWIIEFILPIAFPHLNGSIGGLTERLFLGSVLLWIGVVSFFLTKHQPKEKESGTADQTGLLTTS